MPESIQTQPTQYIIDRPVIERVVEIVEEGKTAMGSMLEECYAIKEEITKMQQNTVSSTVQTTPSTTRQTLDALNEVASGLPAPVPVEEPKPKKFFDKLVGRGKKGREVDFTKAEALAAIRSGTATEEMLEISQAGLQALGIEEAFNRALVHGPAKSMSKLQMAAIALGSTAVAAGSVAVVLYAGKRAKQMVHAEADAAREEIVQAAIADGKVTPLF